MKWNYEPQFKVDSGYEDIWEDLSKYNSEMYFALDNKGREELIEEVFQIYRSRNIFPTLYYNKEGIIDELKKCKNKILPSFDGEILDKRPTQGSSLLKYIFPNFFKVICKDAKDNTLYDRFYNDHLLKRTIKFCFEFKKNDRTPLVSTSLRAGLEMIGGNIPTNFLPMKVRMLVDYYMNKGENFYDFSCGFGGRMLGVLSSNKNLNYFGLEPNTETFEGLNKLNLYIKEAYNCDNKVEIYKQGSEEEIPNSWLEKMDFCFSSPSYFSLERYSDEETQCYIKYPKLQDWLDGYVNFTIKNIYKVLKKGKYYAVNINDFKVNNSEVTFVKDWIEISKQNGFILEKVIPMKLGRKRPNSIDFQKVFASKEENIYLFKKI